MIGRLTAQESAFGAPPGVLVVRKYGSRVRSPHHAYTKPDGAEQFDLMQEAAAVFKKHFSFTPPHIVRAPGRLEVLGNHTDYNDGLVMAVAVNRYLSIACGPRTDGKIEMVSSASPGHELFWMSDIRKNPSAPWADYVKGVLAELRRRGVAFSGLNLAIHSTIPWGAGLGSSAALEVATALAVRKLYPYSLTERGATLPPKRNERGDLPPLAGPERLFFAQLCRAAEQDFVGAPCGPADHAPVLFGKAWNVMSIDCQSQAVEQSPVTGEAIIICHSGVRHENARNEYAKRRHLCESAAQKLGAKSLRSVELKVLQANKGRLEPREYECAYHVVGELARVVAAERALREDDHRQFGQYMFQSHESSRDYLRNSCPELDLLVELARRIPGCLGARLTGRGFGGATINLVAYHQAESFMEIIAREYEKRAGRKAQPMICQMVAGAA